MSFNDALLDLMPSTLHVDPMSSLSTDGYGTFVFTTSTASYRCRHVIKQTEVTNLQGEQEVANSVLYIKSASTFAVSDKLSIGGVELGPVIRVEQYPDEDGHHHTQCFLG